jgi:hypothetical protein
MRRRNIWCAKWAAMVGLALALGPCAAANTLYTYIGNPFTAIVGTPGVPDKYNTSDFIEVMLTTVNPLPANMSVMTAIDPTQIVAFQITDGVDPMGPINAIFIGTDPNGAINQWNILNISQTNNPNTTFGTGNFPGAVADLAAVTNVDGARVQAGSNQNMQGIWTVTAGVPEPATWLLTIAGLAALAVWRTVQGKAKVRPLG